MCTHRTLIVPAAVAENAKGLAKQFGPAADGMWTTALSPTGELPATHYVSAGHIGTEFADFLPCKRVTHDAEGNAQIAETPANHAAFDAMAKAAKVAAPPKAGFDALMAAVDVSDEDPWAAMTRLGLQMVQQEI